MYIAQMCTFTFEPGAFFSSSMYVLVVVSTIPVENDQKGYPSNSVCKKISNGWKWKAVPAYVAHIYFCSIQLSFACA